MVKIGFLINPIAGMGGRVGLKGTDGVVERAKELGAQPQAHEKAQRAIEALISEDKENKLPEVTWLTCSDPMGERILIDAGIPKERIEVVYECGESTTAEDTISACTIFKESGCDLVLFCGGDGTARDLAQVVKNSIPLVGIPSGVKMYSGVFSMNPAKVGEIIADFLNGMMAVTDVDIMDMDEDRYRQGVWEVRLYTNATTLNLPNLIQAGKMQVDQVADVAILEGIAEHIIEEMGYHPESLFILGPGSTINTIAEHLEVKNTILGIDVVKNKELLASDVNEETLLELLKTHEEAYIVLSPIGAQGFLIGRGNLQLSPNVIRRIGLENLLIVSTPSKLTHTPVLRIDTGDPQLNQELSEKEHIFVIYDYRSLRLVELEI